jgi:hypothetical protein
VIIGGLGFIAPAATARHGHQDKKGRDDELHGRQRTPSNALAGA